MHKKVSQQ